MTINHFLEEIKNLKEILNTNKIYFGAYFNSSKVFSYAASIGDTSLKELQKIDLINFYLDRMIKIGVRDEYTANVLKKLTKNDINLVCDPTFLLSKKVPSSKCCFP